MKKVQVGKDQEKAQSEKDSHSKNRGGKKQTNNQVLIPCIFLDVLHFSMKNIKSRDLDATPMDAAMSKPASDVVCLLLLS